jgi:hypothetical protein
LLISSGYGCLLLNKLKKVVMLRFLGYNSAPW